MSHLEMLIIALLLDAAFGEPRWLWSRITHPVVLMGQAVDYLDKLLNHKTARIARGIVALLALVLLAWLVGLAIAWVPDWGVLEVLVAAVLLAHRSLVDHVRAVADALIKGVPQGRVAVSMIVGRDTAAMDASDVSRAAIESGAENFSDGVIAPAFWFLVFGAPGLIAYKIINTADSMIGHRTEAYLEFGRASARLDDVVNWIPARLSGCLIAVVSGQSSILQIWEEAGNHRSPNAGWPESAMATSLGVALAGPRSYGGESKDYPYMNAEGRRKLSARDIRDSIRLLWRSWIGLLLTLISLWLIIELWMLLD